MRLLLHCLSVAIILTVTIANSFPQKPQVGATKTALVWSDGKITWIDSSNRAEFNSAANAIGSTLIKTRSGITWQVTFEDVQQQTKKHFDDPQLGGDRQRALFDILDRIAETLNSNRVTLIKVLIKKSYEDSSSGTLASASTSYSCCVSGFFLGSAGTFIQTGVDPDPNLDDVFITVNFASIWYHGKGKPPSNAYDLRSVLTHEVTHALGIASLLNSNGKSRYSNSNPGVFSTLDMLLGVTKGTNRKVLFDGMTKKFIGTPSDLLGANGEIRFKGFNAVLYQSADPQMYSPSAFKLGSSISHFAPTFSANAVMVPAIGPGIRKRSLQHFEVGVLRDLGYKNARVLGDDLFNFAKPKSIPTVPGKNLIDAALVMDIDGNGTLDYLTLEQEPTESILTVNSSRVSLGSRKYYSMSAALVGPEDKPGIILEERNGGEILALADYRRASGTSTVRQSFLYYHSAFNTTPGSSSALRKQNFVTTGDVDGDGDKDVVSILHSTQAGGESAVSYVNEGGYFDGFFKTSKMLDLPGSQIITADLAAEPYFSNLFIPFKTSLNPPDGNIAWVNGKTGARNNDLSPVTVTKQMSHLSAGYSFNRMYGVRATNTGQGNEIVAVKMDGTPKYSIVSSLFITGGVSDLLHNRDSSTGIDTVYFIDRVNHSIEKVSTNFASYSRIAGGGVGSDDGNSTNARFNNPTGICASGGNLFVLDSGNKLVRRIELKSKRVDTLAGVLGVSGSSDGEKGVATFNLGAWQNCWVIGDSLYIVDATPTDPSNLIRKVNVNTGYTTTVSPTATGSFDYPLGFKGFSNQIFTIQGNFSNRSIFKRDLRPPVTSIGSSDSLLTARLNNDQCLDAVGVWKGVISTFISKCDGTFRFVEQPNLSFTKATDFGLGDLNGDGKTDLAIVGGTKVEIYSGDGAGKFQIAPTLGFILDFQPLAVRVGDFNNDGMADFATLDALGELKIFLKNATGRWDQNAGSVGEAFSIFVDTSTSPKEIPKWFSLDDVNEDNLLDIVVGFENAKRSVFYLGKTPL